MTKELEEIDGKLDVKLDLISKRIEALESPPEENDEDEAEDKKDALTIAKDVIRNKLDGLLSKEKLDKMDIVELSSTLAHIKKTIENPSEVGGILNPIEAKTDSFKAGLFGAKDEKGVVFE